MESDIILTYSDNETSEDIVYDLMKVEESAYEPEYRGEYDSILRRFRKYKEMFVLASCRGRIVGYLCFFPISRRLHDDIMYSDTFHDDDIAESDVMHLGASNNIYLLSVALMKEYQNQGIGKRMMESFFARMRQYAGNGCDIEDILASVVTGQGESLAREFNMKEIKNNMQSKGYKLFFLSGEDI